MRRRLWRHKTRVYKLSSWTWECQMCGPKYLRCDRLNHAEALHDALIHTMLGGYVLPVE